VVVAIAMCKRCRFKTYRDSLGAMNIWLRALQAYAGGAWVTPKRPRCEG